MICYEFKGGTGTASRVVPVAGLGDHDSDKTYRTYTVGALVQANCGRRPELTIAGVPVGKEIPGEVYKEQSGSIIIVIATDVPLLPHQLKRLAKRASLGLARTGTISKNSSGDLFIAFSTANAGAEDPEPIMHSIETIPNDHMDPIFTAVAQSTEEAIINALVDNQTMTGRDNHRVDALPHNRLRELLKKYNCLP
jgi:L-aminopeptidase/D-esterase-like protein